MPRDLSLLRDALSGVVSLVEAEPDRLDMCTFASYERTWCGTSCCIGGHLRLLDPEMKEAVRKANGSYDRAARSLYGLDEDETEVLFHNAARHVAPYKHLVELSDQLWDGWPEDKRAAIRPFVEGFLATAEAAEASE